MTGQVTPRRPRVPEKVVQRQVVNLLRSVGAQVWVLGTTRKRTDSHFGTMQTPGVPDLLAFVRGELVCIEVKAQDGRLSMAQVQFRACCVEADVVHVVGGVDDVLRYLVARGIVREDGVAWYRRTPA